MKMTQKGTELLEAFRNDYNTLNDLQLKIAELLDKFDSDSIESDDELKLMIKYKMVSQDCKSVETLPTDEQNPDIEPLHSKTEKSEVCVCFSKCWFKQYNNTCKIKEYGCRSRTQTDFS